MFNKPQNTMKTVEDLLARMNQRVVTLRPMSLVAESIELLAKHNIGAVVILDESGGAIGILSERDVMKALAASGTEILSRPVDKLMTKNIVCCSPRDGLLTSMTHMLHHGFRHLPIVDGGTLLGLVSIRDLLSAYVDKEQTEQEYLAGALHMVRRQTEKKKADELDDDAMAQVD